MFPSGSAHHAFAGRSHSPGVARLYLKHKEVYRVDSKTLANI